MESTNQERQRKRPFPTGFPSFLPTFSERPSPEGASNRSLAIEAIFNQMTEGLVIFDPEGNLVDMNPAALAIHGFENVERIQRHLDTLTDVFELFDLAGNALATKDWPIARALRGEKFEHYVVRVARRDTDKWWIGSYGGAPVLDAEGSMLLGIVTLRDITAAWESEQALTRAKKQIETALTATEVGVWHWDVQQNRMVGDPNALRIFGIDERREGVPIERYMERVYEDDRDRVGAAVDAVLTHGGSYSEEYRIVRPGGQERWVLARGHVEISDEGIPTSFPGVVVDITDRKRAEMAARESDARFRVMADGLPFIIWVHGADGKQEFVNRTFTEYFGLSVERMKGDVWQSLMHPDDAPAYVEEFLRCAREQRPFRATVRVRRADGAWRSIESHGRPRFSESGEFQGFVGASVDVTERLEAEREVRLLNQTLERRVAERTADLEERNRELQNFAYIASHDLREPLRKIRTFGDLLREETGEVLNEEASMFVDRMSSAAVRMDTLLEDLLRFSRISTEAGPMAPVELARVMADALGDFDQKIKGLNARLDVHAAGTIEADERQIRQLISSLVDNALKFRRPDVRPHITLRASVEPKDSDGATCRIIVEDNGIGFDPKYVDRIFNPLERLHGRNDYEGTGMGLAGCRRIVKRHRGQITAESVPGQGSRFTVELPVSV